MPSSALRCEVPVLREMKLVPCRRPAKLYVGGIVQRLCADHVRSLRLLGVILTRIDRRKRDRNRESAARGDQGVR
jgi:hypothetical protein